MEQDFANKIVGGCRLDKLLGKGGMGSVYRAHHLNLDIDVAVKFLDKNLASSQDLIERFILEARAAARLDSPNIVRVLQVGEENSLYFIQMELVEGESLAQKLKREAPLAIDAALLDLYQITMGLSAAHQANIVHRDIKPENILINKKGVLKITDFGLAKSLQSTSNLTREGQILGTPYYLSPEQCEGRASDARSDIYSLGVTFYYMITGQLPFQGETPIAIAVARLRVDPPMPRKVRPEIPEAIENLTMKMMAREVDARYANTELLLQDIVDLMPQYGVSFQRQTTIVTPVPRAASPSTTATRLANIKGASSSQTVLGPVASPNSATLVEGSENNNSLANPGTGEEVKPSNPTCAFNYAVSTSAVPSSEDSSSTETLASTPAPIRTIQRGPGTRRDVTVQRSQAPAGDPTVPLTRQRPPAATPTTATTTVKPQRRFWVDAVAIILVALFLSINARKMAATPIMTMKDRYAEQLMGLPDSLKYQEIVGTLLLETPQENQARIRLFTQAYPHSPYVKLVKDIGQQLAKEEKTGNSEVKPLKNNTHGHDQPTDSDPPKKPILDKVPIVEELQELDNLKKQIAEYNRKAQPNKTLELLDTLNPMQARMVRARMIRDNELKLEIIKSLKEYINMTQLLISDKQFNEAETQIKQMQRVADELWPRGLIGRSKEAHDMIDKLAKALQRAIQMHKKNLKNPK